MTPSLMRTWRALACAAAGALAVTGGAEPLKGVGDPTRPPPGLMPDAGRADGGGRGPGVALTGLGAQATAAAASAAQAGAGKATFGPLVLQAIRYDAFAGQGLALISGQWVQAGERVHGMRVQSVSRDAVVLKGQGGLKRLSMSPQPDQTRPDAGPAASSGGKE